MPPSSIHMDHVRATHQAMRAEAAGTPKPEKAEGEEMSFWDVLDVVNPLQHIPVVNKIYQAVTGDTIKTPAKLAGSALFFGPIGLAVAAADAVVEKETGKDTIGNVASLLGIGGKGGETAPAALPAEDDPLTVTAPRPQRRADAAPVQTQDATPIAGATATASSLPVQELSSGQAAMLERLMAGNGGGNAGAGPASGGIGNAKQLKDLQTTPGASAAAMAAAGLGPQAALASLPAPGSGAGDNIIAAMAQEQQQPQLQQQPVADTGSFGNRNASATTGRTLADYRAAAISKGSMGVKPLVPSTAVQMAQQHSNMPAHARAAMTTQAPLQTQAAPAPAAAGGTVANTSQMAASPAIVQPTAQPTESTAQPAAPSKDRIAELMMMGINKYQQQQNNAAAAVAAANANGVASDRKAAY